MTFLELQTLTPDLLPAALELDQRCFGGLWTLDGYRRELESPNSELLVLQKAETRRQRAQGARQASEGGKAPGTQGRGDTENSSLQHSKSSSTVSPQFSEPIQHSKLKTQSPSSPHPTPFLVALGCYWAILEEAHITILAVDPNYQRQGVGQALLYALLRSAQGRGLERATLEVRISNQSALSLYEKFGFREAGRRKRYYQDTGEDALVLWRGGLQSPEFSELLYDWQPRIRNRLQGSGWQFFPEQDDS
ncbi:ribosomal protein S18-alanine N-acetyltransferase [Kovacikia minuta CCNUW1]|uniref:ribosomal protein S18-alanine N-acetyltransferase n=1 Tax=Kovacikia minuta TaxID=2931930 RepID=UPI001CCAF9C5|nr:ribosomal protein S18-alanine N-acetyltransferase [Kovacikia minuta]UBF26803.1 ribosomal protein S18-alanine N-acetyltransferase [Kovacikia minuta CCNUW1]